MTSMTRLARFLAVLAITTLAVAQPVAAQSILRDAETEAVLSDMSRPLIEAAGLSPANVKVVMVADPSLNAFVAGGQIVFINSGTIDQADNANEVQGVIAHEIGHIVGGHVPLSDRMFSGATGISLLSLVLGIAAIAAGGGAAGAGILAAGQQAALGKVLAFSRQQEASSDAAGVRFLGDAGINGQGMLDFFKKTQAMEYRYGINRNEDSFFLTHPMSLDRITTLQADVRASPAFGKKTDPTIDVRFKRVQAKLIGYTHEPREVLNRYPRSDQSIYAHYARAYAQHRAGYPTEAAAEAAALVKSQPDDPYFLELQGQIMLESGQPREALSPLRRATELSRNNPLIATLFGHALIATDDSSLLPEAERVLRASVQRDDENPAAWMQLATVYERKGDEPRLALANAERFNRTGDPGRALASARAALAGLPKGSSDWIRAQDILLVSQSARDDARTRRQ